MWTKFTLGVLATVIACLVEVGSAYSSSDPTWLVSPYFRANNERIINTTTGNDSTPTYTFTFSSALSGVPNLAYGIKNYRGQDTLINEKFQIRRVNLTASTYTVSIQIFGFTNIYLLTVAYLAVDPDFPHHLNSFDNVPINESEGNLVNISTRTIGTTVYLNTIDYSVQSAGNNFSTFQTPLSSNKMVLYISSLFILSYNQPVQLTIEYEVLNTTCYQWKATLFQNISIERLHFSQIVYNEDDVSSSGLYAIVYEEWTIDSTGGYMGFPHELKDNMIMALTDFQSIDARCGLEYNWDFVTNQGGLDEAIKLNASNPSNYNCGLDVARSTLFYIKTWECSSPFVFYNLTNDGCQDGCADYHFVNAASSTCDPCYYACVNCTVGYDANSCNLCEASAHRTLVSNSCVCDSGYFDDGHGANCRACGDAVAHCSECSYFVSSSEPSHVYEAIFAEATWTIDISADFSCSACETPYFLNGTGECEACSLGNCQTCSTLTTCSVCDSPYFLNSSSLCELCSLTNCQTCSTLTTCSVCDSPYFLNDSSLCEACSLSYCLTCNSLSNCSLCNSSASAVLHPIQSLCYLCSHDPNCLYCSADDFCASCLNDTFTIVNGSCFICEQSCNCGGWVGTLVNGSCQTECGDGYLRGEEECEPGLDSTVNCDSSSCTIIEGYIVAEDSAILGLGLFLLGFRIVGLEMLFVFQSVQLLLAEAEYPLFQISWNVHGFSDIGSYPLAGDGDPSVITQHFNFMFDSILLLFMVALLMETCGKCCRVENKVENSPQKSDKMTIHLSEPSENSEEGADFTVHMKSRQNEQQGSQSWEAAESEEGPGAQQVSRVVSAGRVAMRQVLFDLAFCCLPVVAYSLSEEAAGSANSLLSFSSVLKAASMSLLLLGLLVYCSSPDRSFGENQLKFHRGRWMAYWALVLAERLLTSLLISCLGSHAVYACIGLKAIVLGAFALSQLFYEKFQKLRSLSVQTLHLSTLLTLALQGPIRNAMLGTSAFFVELLVLSQLGLVLLITLAFYIREGIHGCSADYFRYSQDHSQESESHTAEQSVVSTESSKFEEDSSQDLGSSAVSFVYSSKAPSQKNSKASISNEQFVPRKQFQVHKRSNNRQELHSSRGKNIFQLEENELPLQQSIPQNQERGNQRHTKSHRKIKASKTFKSLNQIATAQNIGTNQDQDLKRQQDQKESAQEVKVSFNKPKFLKAERRKAKQVHRRNKAAENELSFEKDSKENLPSSQTPKSQVQIGSGARQRAGKSKKKTEIEQRIRVLNNANADEDSNQDYETISINF